MGYCSNKVKMTSSMYSKVKLNGGQCKYRKGTGVKVHTEEGKGSKYTQTREKGQSTHRRKNGVKVQVHTVLRGTGVKVHGLA